MKKNSNKATLSQSCCLMRLHQDETTSPLKVMLKVTITRPFSFPFQSATAGTDWKHHHRLHRRGLHPAECHSVFYFLLSFSHSSTSDSTPRRCHLIIFTRFLFLSSAVAAFKQKEVMHSQATSGAPTAGVEHDAAAAALFFYYHKCQRASSSPPRFYITPVENVKRICNSCKAVAPVTPPPSLPPAPPASRWSETAVSLPNQPQYLCRVVPNRT